uniref:Uncharacterized protein n=1 Tax=Oryza nivara TaxID=4536 RepID=A0A0E0IPX4_ORYNI
MAHGVGSWRGRWCGGGSDRCSGCDGGSRRRLREIDLVEGARAWLLGNLVQKPLSVIPVNLANSGSEQRSKKLRKEAEMSKSGRKRLCKVL